MKVPEKSDSIKITELTEALLRGVDLPLPGTVGNTLKPYFPIFKHHAEAGRPLHYLDSAASSQKPSCVIARLAEYLAFEHANVRRGAYELSSRASENLAKTRQAVARYFNAPNPESIVFVRGATEGINLVARATEHLFSANDTVLCSILEHHSNIVPWQLLAQRRGNKVAFIDCSEDAVLATEHVIADLKRIEPQLLALTHQSNAFGTTVDLETIAPLARAQGTMVLADLAQSVLHRKIDLQKLGVDFAVLSGHKLYGPTGVGILYISPAVQHLLQPFMGGGDMIERVTTNGSSWAAMPHKFEAGTPAIAEIIAFERAIAMLESIGIDNIAKHEERLFRELHEKLKSEPGVKIYGPQAPSHTQQQAVVSFSVDNVHPHDIATIADQHGVQIRAGHHCAMPAMTRLKIQASARASLGAYSSSEDIDALITAIRAAKKVFG
jgi:cysteine desulfurase/selenocysteine lyase